MYICIYTRISLHISIYGLKMWQERSRFSLNKIFFHVQAFVHEPILLLLPLPLESPIRLQSFCNTIAQYPTPFRPPVFTPYTIRYCALQYLVKANSQWLYCRLRQSGTRAPAQRIHPSIYLSIYLQIDRERQIYRYINLHIQIQIQIQIHRQTVSERESERASERERERERDLYLYLSIYQMCIYLSIHVSLHIYM